MRKERVFWSKDRAVLLVSLTLPLYSPPPPSLPLPCSIPQPVAPITAIAMPGYNYYNSNIPASDNERLVALFSMARAIRTFASIDAFFILCYMGLFSFVFVGAAWGPVFGFLSARQVREGGWRGKIKRQKEREGVILRRRGVQCRAISNSITIHTNTNLC